MSTKRTADEPLPPPKKLKQEPENEDNEGQPWVVDITSSNAPSHPPVVDEPSRPLSKHQKKQKRAEGNPPSLAQDVDLRTLHHILLYEKISGTTRLEDLSARAWSWWPRRHDAFAKAQSKWIVSLSPMAEDLMAYPSKRQRQAGDSTGSLGDKILARVVSKP
jgi:hypothetical protein